MTKIFGKTAGFFKGYFSAASSRFSDKFPWGTFVFVIAFFGVIVPCTINGKLPGDLMDSRFNSYILEHFFQVLSGKDESFVNGSFLYPLPETIMFTDNYWGSALIYSYFRYSDLGVEASYAGWVAAMLMLTYVAAFYVFLKLELSRLASAIAAFLFAFGLPILAQDIHPHYFFRAYVPLSFLALHLYLQRRDLRYAALAALFLALQFLVSIYLGLFLLLMLFLFFVISIWPFSENKIHDILPQKFSPKISIPVGIVAIILLAIFTLPYLQVKNDYGFHRHYGEATSMLPRIQSYFIADHSSMWVSAFNKSPEIPMRHEHQLFVGIGAFICLLLIALRRDFRQGLLARKMSSLVVVMTLLTLSFGGISFYWLVAHVPGFSVLRAVSREFLILLFPLSYLVGLALDKLKNLDSGKFSASAAIFILCALIIGDSIFANRYLTSKGEWKKRIATLQKQLPERIDPSSILVIKSNSVEDEIDAMILSQRLGIKTIHGYSGFMPFGINFINDCADVKNIVEIREEFMREHFDKNFAFDRDKLIYLGITRCIF